MCFSPAADLVGGVVISAIGVDVLRQVKGRRRFLALATLPLLFGLHQFTETFVWWGTDGTVPHPVATAALWAYLLVAFVVLPTFVPLAILLMEPPGVRRRLMAALATVGAAVSTTLLVSMIAGPVRVRAASHHLAYDTPLHAGLLVVSIYVMVTCGAPLMSGERLVASYGAVNLVAVGVIAWLLVDGFASVWCAWAAVSSAAVSAYLRGSDREQAELLAFAGEGVSV